MQSELENIEHELTSKIYKLFLEKFDGNKSAFAKASGCRESTIRRILRNEQGITMNLMLRLAYALDTTVSELTRDLKITKEN